MNRSKLTVCASALLTFILVAGSAMGAVAHKRSSHSKPATRPAVASLRAPSFVLPAGATVVTELSLSDDNLLSMMKNSIPAFTQGASGAKGFIGQFIKDVKFDDLYAAVKGVKALRVVHFKMRDPMASDHMIAFFQAQVPASKGWERLIYHSDVPEEGLVAVYTRNGEYIGICINPKTNKNVAFGTVGFLDLAKLSSWSGHVTAVVSKYMESDFLKGFKSGMSGKEENKPATSPTDDSGTSANPVPDTAPAPTDPATAPAGK